MIALIIGMLLCVGLAIAIVGLVAIPARREGRDLLTARGEDLLASVRDVSLPGMGSNSERETSSSITEATQEPVSSR